ncbi:exopolysaccharide biosynthesis polyprenyl glycosylphosphotransferase [Microbacterium rhizophilus]|uniref:exopolysaccharide biosynthesis polyprenyl glycosylphosphotransferase n=1 Tax=Microbacterium rhizophilus TaxID=3138934 RepID=UPI0031E4F0EE
MTAIDASLPVVAGASAPHSPLTAARPEAAVVPLPGLAAPATASSLARRRHRDAAHRRLLVAGDTVVVAATATLAAVAGGEPASVAAAMVAAVVWWAGLRASRSHDPLTPSGRELGRIATATAGAMGALAIAAVLLDGAGPSPFDVAHVAPLLAASPFGLLALAAVRRLWRRRLAARLRVGEHVARAILIGAGAELAALEQALAGSERIRVCGTVVWGDGVVDGHLDGTALAARAVDAAAMLHADTVIVARVPDDPGFLRRLAWGLEGTAAELLVWPGLSDVAASRVRVHWSGSLPLLRVTQPVYDVRRAAKRAVDVAVATAALVPIGLLAAPIAVAIRIDSPGPVFFRQDRVGEGGRIFSMIKFRSMTATAERERAALAGANEAAGPMFKLQRDPRVTRVGRVLRRYSLDELPQFWNVLTGDMSVIGPRPALPSEVTAYDEDERRRLYVRPGISGPWQVSGRSDLDWERGVALDLHYVENRSLAGDLRLMLRTVGAVVRPRGAY